jgi:hypothetical protein
MSTALSFLLLIAARRAEAALKCAAKISGKNDPGVGLGRDR